MENTIKVKLEVDTSYLSEYFTVVEKLIEFHKQIRVDLPQRLAYNCELATTKPTAIIASIVKREINAIHESLFGPEETQVHHLRDMQDAVQTGQIGEVMRP